MKHRNKLLAVSLMLSMNYANASLHDRGGGLIYDDVLNITWLQDANYAKTSGYDSDGQMTWNEAMAWAEQLVYAGHKDWRLPMVGPVNGTEFNYITGNDGTTDWGYNITSANAELSYMFYVNLGNQGEIDIDGDFTGCFLTSPSSCLTNTGPFINLQEVGYWYGVESELDLGDAWEFNPFRGFQDIGPKDKGPEPEEINYFAWAVHPGDVAPIPIPAAFWLFGSSCLGVLALAGLNKSKHSA